MLSPMLPMLAIAAVESVLLSILSSTTDADTSSRLPKSSRLLKREGLVLSAPNNRRGIASALSDKTFLFSAEHLSVWFTITATSSRPRLPHALELLSGKEIEDQDSAEACCTHMLVPFFGDDDSALASLCMPEERIVVRVFEASTVG